MANRLGYDAVFSASAVEFFTRLNKRRQRKLLDRTHELVADPFLIPDFRTTDAAGREISHLIAEEYIFDFWIDHAVKQVVITEITEVE